MMPYENICSDLSLTSDNFPELSPAPYRDELDEKSKIILTYRCLLRAQRLKQRKRSLIFAFYLGQLIENNNFSAKEMKKIISEYYYLVAVRIYYIFESNPALLELSQITTLTMVRRLSSNEYHSLVMEI